MKNTDNVVIKYDICVVGAGVCGMFFATKFANNDKKIVVMDCSNKVGGQLNLYKEKHIYNIPLINEIKSCDVIDKLYNDLLKQENCSLISETRILDIELQSDAEHELFLITLFNVREKKNIKIRSRYLVLATGNGEEKPNKLQINNVEKYENNCIFYNVDDEENFRGKDILIAGGGDSVIDWSVELADITKSITVVHRRSINKEDNSNFLKFKSLCESGKVKLKYPYGLLDIVENDSLEKINGVNIKNIENQQVEKIKCDAMLVFYGMKTMQSCNDILDKFCIDYGLNGIKVDYKTNCVIDKSGKCINNIFAIGDCCSFDGKIKNIIASFIDGIKCCRKICNDEK